MKEKELELLFWNNGSVKGINVPFGTTYKEAEEKFKAFQLEEIKNVIKNTSWNFDVNEFNVNSYGGSYQIGRDRYSNDKFEEISRELKENTYEMKSN